MPATTNGSYLYRQGTSAQTESVVSTRFKIYTPVVNQGRFTKMGVTSSFGLSESKTIETIRGLGYGDQIAELVPGVTGPMSISVARTALFLGNLMQQFGYKAGVSGMVRSLKHHKWPFDIKTEIVFSELASADTGQHTGATSFLGGTTAGGGGNSVGLDNGTTVSTTSLLCVATIYEGCWMESFSSTYSVDTTAVAEDCTIQCTDLFDVSGNLYGEFIDSGNNPNGSIDSTGGSLIFTENNANVNE